MSGGNASQYLSLDHEETESRDMSYNQPCSSCISTRDGYRKGSAAQLAPLIDTKNQEKGTRCVNLEDGKLEHEEVVSECPRHA